VWARIGGDVFNDVKWDEAHINTPYTGTFCLCWLNPESLFRAHSNQCGCCFSFQSISIVTVMHNIHNHKTIAWSNQHSVYLLDWSRLQLNQFNQHMIMLNRCWWPGHDWFIFEQLLINLWLWFIIEIKSQSSTSDQRLTFWTHALSNFARFEDTPPLTDFRSYPADRILRKRIY